MTMEEELSISLDGKNLANLRVVDLKQELEKRGLSKSGSKKDLIKRLKQQLEFEKLCEERKSTGDCELKKELDAATEQNEFVQRYLAQQQKIFAEQKEVKRLVELEESQKKSDTEECIISPKIDENHSSDSDTERDEDSSSESSAGKSALKAIEEISSKKKTVGKETVKGESSDKQSSGNKIIEKHIIKIERDKVYTIVSNKNQEVGAEIKLGDDKNSSKYITKKVLSEKECTVSNIKKENKALSVTKNNQTIEKHEDKVNKSHSGIENVSLDIKPNQRDISYCKDDKSNIACNTDKSTSKIGSTCKIADSNIENKDKNDFFKIDTTKSTLIIEDTDKSTFVIEDTDKGALTIEDADKSALVVKNTDKSALTIEDTDKRAVRVEDTDKSALIVEDTDRTVLKSADPDTGALKIEDTCKRALKIEHIDQHVSSKIQKTNENAPLPDESTDKSTLKTKDTDISDSLKIIKIEENSFKIKDTYKDALKNEGTGENTSLKNEGTGKCALKAEHAGESTSLKNEDADKCALKTKRERESALKTEHASECALKK